MLVQIKLPNNRFIVVWCFYESDGDSFIDRFNEREVKSKDIAQDIWDFVEKQNSLHRILSKEEVSLFNLQP